MQKIELFYKIKEKFEALGERYKEIDKRLDELESQPNYSELSEYQELRGEQIGIYEKRRKLHQKANELKDN